MSLTGLISRAAGALRAEVKKAASFDYLHHQKELLVLNFHKETDLQRWIVGSDEDIGGFSLAKLDLTDRNTAVFHGHLSQNLPTDKQIVRSGYAAIRTKTPSKALFSEQSWDTLPFRYLCARVKGDQRKYFVNIRSASFMKTDIYQHRLFLRTPGEWETIYVSRVC
ncbi:hypothetical protein IWQ61_000077 [Dispira simplex]|nr:hypothetical protein IWQ61_000077 [Dispira simplex]